MHRVRRGTIVVISTRPVFRGGFFTLRGRAAPNAARREAHAPFLRLPVRTTLLLAPRPWGRRRGQAARHAALPPEPRLP